ncbi:hypothetical protein M2146_002755 [Lachnospiraceae bacterium PF1-22]
MLLNEPTLCTDATVVTTNGKQAYIRNMSSDNAVRYYAQEQKNIKTLDTIDLLKKYAGNLEHDHETAIYHYGTGHGECNVHLLRYLKKNTEETSNGWSEEMASLLCEMNRMRKELVSMGMWFKAPEISKYESRYDKALERGLEENKKTSGKYAKTEEQKFAEPHEQI